MDLENGDVVFECWPRWEDPSRDGALQYPGWPVQFNLGENAGTPTGHLPGIPGEAAHVRVIDEPSGEIVFARCIWPGETDLPVYGNGPYTVEFLDQQGGMFERRRGFTPSR
jgi:hypothetical protein